jgi:regulator of replication initiation timing
MNGHVKDRSRPTERFAEKRSSRATGQSRAGTDVSDLLDRVQKLRSLLPAFAQDTAVARREAAALRSENTELRRRMADLEAQQRAPAR